MLKTYTKFDWLEAGPRNLFYQGTQKILDRECVVPRFWEELLISTVGEGHNYSCVLSAEAKEETGFLKNKAKTWNKKKKLLIFSKESYKILHGQIYINPLWKKRAFFPWIGPKWDWFVKVYLILHTFDYKTFGPCRNQVLAF